MQMPIILDYDGDIITCSSVEDAEKSIEAIDVRAGNVKIYDARGQQLEAHIYRHFLAERVSIQPLPEAADASAALSSAIKRYLRVSGVKAIEGLTLPELVCEVEKKQFGNRRNST